VPARIGAQEPRDRPDVELGIALALHRTVLDEDSIALALLARLAVMGRRGRRDGVHDDPVGAPLARGGARDGADRLLRRVVRREAAPAGDAHRRREVDDATPALR